jgi:hypothetical protein
VSYRVRIIAKLLGLLLSVLAFLVANAAANEGVITIKALLALWSGALLVAGLLLLVPKLV